MKFEELDLNDNILDALEDMRFETCTPIQEKCIPEILAGRDVLGVAQTGTGKTAAYLLPILSMIDDGGYPRDAINCIIMSPTRELAQQIDQAMQGFSYYLPDTSSIAIYGGNDGNRYDQEYKSLQLGADVVIATPGRLISHISLGNADFSKVSFFVLDEADRMLDMGFSEDIMTIAKELPKNCQTIMFSATMPDKIEELAKSLLKNPVEVKIAVSKPAEKIRQSAYICHEVQKLGIVKDLFKAGDLKRVIIFSGKKQKVKQITQALVRLGINAGEMHSDLDQAQRDEMMYRFKSGQIDVLVATDILSRGIDIDDIAMVINYDVPRDPEDYVHRIGRTARAERDGRAITFVSTEDQRFFQQIERFLEKKIERTPLPEGLGEAPEMNPRSSAKAKDRRRKNRDQQAHRRKPNRPKGDERRQAAGQPIEAKEGDNRPAERKNTANRPRKDERSAKDKQQSDDKRRKPQDNRSEQKARKPKNESRQTERKAEKSERPAPSDQSRRRKSKSSASDDRNNRRKNKKEEHRNTPQSQKSIQQPKQAAPKSGKIGKVINWFRSLGKKR